MKEIEAPKANPERILAIIGEASNAKLVVPEFQRSFIWSREDVEELLASILQGYFVGTFLLLDTPAEKPMFPYRIIDGLEEVNPDVNPRKHNTVRLVLDGQQRITSVFYALYQPDIPLRSARHPHKFYLRLDLALNGNLDEAAVGISTRDTRRMAEIQQLVHEEKALSFTLFKDSGRFYEWLYKKQKTWETEVDQIRALYDRFSNFMVPVVGLELESSRDNVVNIFERINRTGISLSLFDLAGARLYLKGVRLRELWNGFESENGKEMASVVKPEFLIKVIAILQGKEPRKGNLLDAIDALEADVFKTRWLQASEAVVSAFKRIEQEYGAFERDWIPYTTMMVPLAALLFDAKKRGAREEAFRKIDAWYWSSVLSQRYDSAVDTKSYQDVRSIGEWCSGGIAPDWMGRVTPDSIDMYTDESRSAVYRGLMCLVARNGAKDFLTGQPAKLNECQDDHIFPKSAYGEDLPVNGILNRTMISKETNIRKKDKSPSEFLDICLQGHGNDEARLQATLDSHFISVPARDALRVDDFRGFVEERKKAITEKLRPILNFA